jgi:hypothetical protein
MRHCTRILSLCGLALWATSFGAHADEAPLKDNLRINNIFVPQEGFDDNDNIEFVLDGELKNACLKLGAASVRTYANIIDVNVESYRDPDTVCAQDDSLLPQAIQITVPFSKEIEVGQLKAGEYTIRFQTPNALVTKAFTVKPAPTDRQDTFNYAPVDNAAISSIVRLGENTVVHLSGMLTSSCMKLRDQALVSRVGDVIVVKPLVNVDLSSKCLMYLRPFHQEVTVPDLGQGRYMVHVRSMNGQALNRVFSVCPANAEGDCASSR